MLKNAKKTKIVCTLGPASDSEEVLTQLVENGLNVCRFNFSHGDHAEQKVRMDTAKKVREKLNVPVALLLDTKGPEIRTGKFADPEVLLEQGQQFIVTMDEVLGTKEKCTVSYKELVNDVKVGDTILIDDGLVGLRINEIKGNDIICTVENSGIVKNHKGVNLPGVKINLPALTPKDISDIEFGIEQDIDFIAASFVRKASDVLAIREILENNNATHIQIISKIENQEGVENLDEILQVSDGLMVARGDLGVEVPTEEMPIIQKDMIRKCNELGKPVITATQMLDSMIRNPRPTRAEVTDVANAIYDGTDAIMLSGETAKGKYPVEAVKMMNQIAISTELHLDTKIKDFRSIYVNRGISAAVAYSAVQTAHNINAKCILASSMSGFTARIVSKFKPDAQIIGLSPDEAVVRKMQLYWGVRPFKSHKASSTRELLDEATEIVTSADLAQENDILVLTGGGPADHRGKGVTNMLKVVKIGE